MLTAVLALGCAGGSDAPLPDPEAGLERVEAPGVLDFYERATVFYRRLEGRRFNSIVTFRDAGLHEYFRDEESFSDYYADLAEALLEAHFQRSRPIHTEIAEFLVDGPGRASVRVHLRGDNALPLRWWKTHLEREDRWVRRAGQWWIQPGQASRVSAP